MANEIYNKLANALNSSFVEEDALPDTLNKHLPTNLVEEEDKTPMVVDDKPNLPAPVKKQVFDEQIYVKNKLHETVDLFSDVMKDIKEDLRQGTPATKYEALSSMGRTLISALNELRSYDTAIKHEEQYDEGSNDPSGQNDANVTINLNGADMLDKILEYRDNNIPQAEAEVVEEKTETKEDEE